MPVETTDPEYSDATHHEWRNLNRGLEPAAYLKSLKETWDKYANMRTFVNVPLRKTP